MCSYSSLGVFGSGMGTVIEEEENDIPPLDMTNARDPDDHLYPVEEEDEEEDEEEEDEDDAEMEEALPRSQSHDQIPSRTTVVPSATMTPPNIPAIGNTNDNSISASAVAVLPNAVAPASFAPPAYGEEPPDIHAYALPHSSMEYLLPPNAHASSSSRRSCRRRTRSRPRSRLFPFFRLPCSRRFRRFWRLKRKERNVPAAATSILVIAFLVTSLALPRWFYLFGGACKIHDLGALDFFSLTVSDLNQNHPKYDYVGSSSSSLSALHSMSHDNIEWGDCISPQIITLMRTVIVLVFAAISFTFAAFFLDAIGAQSMPYKFCRRHAVGNIVTVLLCVLINGFAYWVSTLIRAQQSANKTLAGKKIEVNFDVSFYLVVGAGGFSVIATAANLLKQHPTEEEEQISRLVDCEENEVGDEPEGTDDNLLERRMRNRGDWSSLYNNQYSPASPGDTLMSTYPRSMAVGMTPPSALPITTANSRFLNRSPNVLPPPPPPLPPPPPPPPYTP